MDDFINFIRRQGVIGLAVGLAIGLQATVTVQTIVAGFVDPLAGWFLGLFMNDPGSLHSLTWTIISGENPLVLSWGAIFSSVLSLLAVVAVIYFLVMKTSLNKLDKED